MLDGYMHQFDPLDVRDYKNRYRNGCSQCYFFSESLMQFRPLKFETSRNWHEILA